MAYLCYIHGYHAGMMTWDEFQAAAKKDGWRLVGVRPEKWKQEWGVPQFTVVERPVHSVKNIWECPFIGDLWPFYIFMSHNIGRLEEYVEADTRVGHPKYRSAGTMLTPKEVLTEVAEWQRLHYCISPIISSQRASGMELEAYQRQHERFSPWENENNKKTIDQALIKCGEMKP